MTCATTTKDSPEAKRWLIVGAFQAGASEKKIAKMVGLSKTAVRNIILNYKHTGDPSLPKRDPKKVKGKLLVEYDENGNLMMSEDEEDDKAQPQNVQIKKKQHQIQKRSPKIKRTITTKDLIEYMIEEVKRFDKELSPISSINPIDEPYNNNNGNWCPTPPRESGLIHHHNEINHSSVSSSYLPLSPPISSNKSSTDDDLDDDQQNHPSSPDTFNLSLLSPTPSSSTATTTTNNNNNNYSPLPYDQNIRGYEPWTHKEDLILMQHALTHLQVGHWRALENRFEGRHTNRLCMERWNFLRARLLKSIIHSITNDNPSEN